MFPGAARAGRTQAQPGETIHRSGDTGTVHLFDPTSGIALAA